MRHIKFVILLVLFSGCHHEKNESKSVNLKEIAPQSLTTVQTTESKDSLNDPYSPYYLSDKNYKEIGQMILDNDVIPTDNNVTFRIMDSLLTNNFENRKFYFKVYAKILDKADGALAEAVGVPGMKYVENYTKEFANFSSSLTFSQLSSWANFIAWEILFDSQKNPEESGEKFIKQLKSNCKDIDLIGKKNIDNFCELIIQTIKENKDYK